MVSYAIVDRLYKGNHIKSEKNQYTHQQNRFVERINMTLMT